MQSVQLRRAVNPHQTDRAAHIDQSRWPVRQNRQTPQSMRALQDDVTGQIDKDCRRDSNTLYVDRVTDQPEAYTAHGHNGNI